MASLKFLLGRCRSMKELKQIHSKIVTGCGLQSSIQDHQLLLSFCCADPHGRLMGYACRLFVAIPDPDPFLWNTMIRGFSNSRSPAAAFSLYIEMLSRGVPPDDYTHPFLLKSFDPDLRTELADAIHTHVIRFGFRANPHAQDALIHAYSILGETKAARELFDRSSKRNPVLWNAMISAYNRSNQCEESCRLFSEMEEDPRIDPTPVTLISAISACARLKDLEYGSWIHRRNNGNLSLPLQNALIDMYVKCGDIRTAWSLFESMKARDAASWTAILTGLADLGLMDQARRLFHRIPKHERDAVSWTALIDGYNKASRFREALDAFREMQVDASAMPDDFTIACVLTACANSGALQFGEWVRVRYVESCGRAAVAQDVFLCNALIDLYCKCGRVESAAGIFEKVRGRGDKFTWTVMIAGLAVNGHGEDALSLFARMLRTSTAAPDEVTYVAVLMACSHDGLVDQGRWIFSGMERAHGISPDVGHYGCLVDLLGRAGRIDEALKTVANMPMKPNSRLWRSLLSASRVHQNLAVGELAASRVLELEPSNGAAYVLLSNLYARCGRWEDVGRVKDMVVQRGVRKAPGCSLIEFEGEMHEFIAGDRTHPRIEEIEAKLGEMGKELRLAGYAIDAAEVFVDISEEEKENTIYRHSEKMAIAFGLLCPYPTRAPIRVVKNLRMCLGCHNAVKLISRVYGRDVVVRDGARFHQFSNGLCSCRDYW